MKLCPIYSSVESYRRLGIFFMRSILLHACWCCVRSWRGDCVISLKSLFSPKIPVCREKPRISSGRDNKPTRELTLHPEPPGGLLEETKSIKHYRKRAVRA